MDLTLCGTYATMYLSNKEPTQMPVVSKNDLGFEECICGRMAAKAHCPYCGSYDVYAQGRRHDEFLNDPETGERRRIASFRCKRCAMHFNEWQWRRYCTAPPYVWQARKLQQKQAEQIRDREAIRLTKKQKTLLTEPQILKYINKQRAQEGLCPIDSQGNELTNVAIQAVPDEFEVVRDKGVWRIKNLTTGELVGGNYDTEEGARRDLGDLE